MNIAASVSYTHLDVYKRQHYNDEGFKRTMKEIFGGQPTGKLRLPDVKTLLQEVLGRLSKLEKHIERMGI